MLEEWSDFEDSQLEGIVTSLKLPISFKCPRIVLDGCFAGDFRTEAVSLLLLQLLISFAAELSIFGGSGRPGSRP